MYKIHGQIKAQIIYKYVHPTSSMMAHLQNSTAAPDKVLPDTFEPKLSQ